MLNKWMITVFLGSLWACSHVPAAALKSAPLNLPVSVIFSGNQCLCEQNDLQVKQVNDQTELNAFIDKGTRTLLGGSKTAIPSVDFSKDAVVAIWLGKKPTAGYQLSLDNDVAELKNSHATIRINLTEPDKDAILAQTVTSPCMLLKLPKGGYDTIEVLSQTQNSLAKLSIQK